MLARTGKLQSKHCGASLARWTKEDVARPSLAAHLPSNGAWHSRCWQISLRPDWYPTDLASMLLFLLVEKVSSGRLHWESCHKCLQLEPFGSASVQASAPVRKLASGRWRCVCWRRCLQLESYQMWSSPTQASEHARKVASGRWLCVCWRRCLQLESYQM